MRAAQGPTYSECLSLPVEREQSPDPHAWRGRTPSPCEGARASAAKHIALSSCLFCLRRRSWRVSLLLLSAPARALSRPARYRVPSGVLLSAPTVRSAPAAAAGVHLRAIPVRGSVPVTLYGGHAGRETRRGV